MDGMEQPATFGESGRTGRSHQDVPRTGLTSAGCRRVLCETEDMDSAEITAYFRDVLDIHPPDDRPGWEIIVDYFDDADAEQFAWYRSDRVPVEPGHPDYGRILELLGDLTVSTSDATRQADAEPTFCHRTIISKVKVVYPMCSGVIIACDTMKRLTGHRDGAPPRPLGQ